jgi:hypothetical protein
LGWVGWMKKQSCRNARVAAILMARFSDAIGGDCADSARRSLDRPSDPRRRN